MNTAHFPRIHGNAGPQAGSMYTKSDNALIHKKSYHGDFIIPARGAKSKHIATFLLILYTSTCMKIKLT